jgi:hypothetical protein
MSLFPGMAKPENLEAAMDLINQGTTAEQREKESAANPMPRDMRQPDIDPPGPHLPPPKVKPHTEVDPAPKISALYPKVKLKNYHRR